MKIGLWAYGYNENGKRYDINWEDLSKKEKWFEGIACILISPFSWIIGYLIYYFFKEVL